MQYAVVFALVFAVAFAAVYFAPKIRDFLKGERAALKGSAKNAVEQAAKKLQ